MDTETLKNSGHGRRTDILQMAADIFSLHSKSHVFAPADHFQYQQIFWGKEVQPTAGTAFLLNSLCCFCKILVPAAVVVKG